MSVTEATGNLFFKRAQGMCEFDALAATWPQNVEALGAYFFMISHLHVGSLRAAHCFNAS